MLTSLGLLLAAAGLLTETSAQSCWRDTVCTGPAEPAFSGIWEDFNYSPSSRTVSPVSVLNPDNSYLSSYPPSKHLIGNGSLLIFDFGKEVGGIPTITYTSTGSGAMGVAFTEARDWTGDWSDDSNGSFNPDGALYANLTTNGPGTYKVPDAQLRGGFRYLSLFATTSSSIDITINSIQVELSFQPAWSNLRAYGGYFYSSDSLLNRIWYSGAYTLQTNAVAPNTGRGFPILQSSWRNDANLGSSASSVFVDGSKRDRTVWAGDLCIAVPSILVSIGDTQGVKASMMVQYDHQQGDGGLPFAGPPLSVYGSDTYHMSTMIATHDYFLHTNDQDFLNSIWSKYLLAMSFLTAKIDSTGMFDCTGTNDWGRLTQGGHNTEANMLMYATLTTGSALAGWQGRSDLTSSWTALAATLKSSVNAANYDNSVGAYKNTDTDGSIHPEDGNSMALLYGVADDSNVQSISSQLTTNWGEFGAVCPELPNNIVGFVQSFEVKAHLAANQATRALDLMRLSWGWYLNNPKGTNSTCVEGYLADGTWGYRNTAGYDNDFAYTSHAHGWTTGPTHALSAYVVGITFNAPGGSEWTLAPQFGDLTHAEGGFTSPLGTFSASWTLTDTGYTISWGMPAGTTGNLVFPGAASASGAPRVEINGVVTEGDYDSTQGSVTIPARGGMFSAVVHT